MTFASAGRAAATTVCGKWRGKEEKQVSIQTLTEVIMTLQDISLAQTMVLWKETARNFVSVALL